jgi:ribosome-binding factor A
MGRQSFDRATRLASTIKKELGEMINGRQLRELKDPRLAGLISVTEVRVTNGYQHMDVFLSIFEEEHQQDVLAVCKEASSAIRGEICRRFHLRTAPTLVFHLDESIKRGFEVFSLLDKIQDNVQEEV